MMAAKSIVLQRSNKKPIIQGALILAPRPPHRLSVMKSYTLDTRKKAAMLS